MPIPKNILREWFSNLKKPPEAQFWGWQDAFWHKLEQIPTSIIENLDNILRKKADLVNGIVPEDQLPFSVKTSEVLQIGTITATENTVKVWVHSSGKNRVRLNGVIYERAFANPFTYTAVINFSKILIVYALPVVGLFFLAEGVEAVEAIEPELPEGAFIIRRILVNQTGQIIEPPIADGLKYNEEDGWRNIMLSEALTVLPYTFDLRSSYWIEKKAANPTIGGIRNSLIDKNTSPYWDGKEFWIYNNTGGDLPLNSAAVTEEDVFLFANAITLKPAQSCKVKIRRDSLEIVGVLSSGSALPQVGNNGDVLTKDSTLPEGAKWTARIKGVTDKMLHYWDATIGNFASTGIEFVSSGIIKLKVIAFGGYTILQRNEISNPIEGMLIYVSETPKGFQKYEGGAWTPIGSNISNADLSNISVRTFTQGNDFTWNSNGFVHYLKNGVRIDKITLPSQSLTTEPNRLANKDGRLTFSDTSSNENQIAYLSDLQARLIKRYVHSSNTEINLSALDISTGYVTTIVPHGLSHTGQRFVGLFTNGIANGFKPIPSRVIPYEYTTSAIYIQVVNSTTLKICTSTGAVIPVNPAYSSNAQIDVTKWHIEILNQIKFVDLPIGIFKFEMIISGVGTTGCAQEPNGRYYTMKYITSSNAPEYSYGNMPAFASNPSRNNVDHTLRVSFDFSQYVQPRFVVESTAGGGYDVSGYNGTFFMGGQFPQIGNKGFVGIENSSTNNNLANGSVISIYLI